MIQDAMGTLSTIYPMRHLFCVALRVGVCGVVACALAFGMLSTNGELFAQTTSALSVPLLLPTAVAFDGAGNLYFAETNHHVIRKVDTTGVLTTIAGNGTQGFSGDGGPATAALLDSPGGVAVDGVGDVFVADTHNHRVRRVDAGSGVITTVAGTGAAGFAGDGGPAAQASLNLPSAVVLDGSGNLFIADVNNHRIRKLSAAGVMTTVAGNGQQGFAGDGGAATAAALDSPSGLAVDASGNLYLADTRNHQVRVVRAGTGVISTLAGTGVAGFSGDNAAANAAALALPRGVSVDSAGNVTIADTNNQRVRRISASGTITTVAGDGTQAFAGDGGPAVSASLDTPRGVALSPAGLVTVADTGNQRVRQIAADATMTTIAGLGAAASETLSLAGPAIAVYGTGTLMATLTSNVPAGGSVAFYESTAGGPRMIGSAALAGGVAGLSTAGLPVGSHQLYAGYAGDVTHPATQSAAVTLTISPAPAVVTGASASILYGQAVPALTGTLTGVLPQDTGKVTLALMASAAALAPPGNYPVAGTLSGAAAGNYALAPVSAAVTISKAPSVATLSVATASVGVGQPLGLALHVASTTSGLPTGSVMVLDGGSPVATLPLSAGGDAAFTSSGLAAGSHTLTAAYPGDVNFLASTTVAQIVTVTNIVPADFTLAATGPTSQTVSAGSTVAFPFTVQMQGAALSSPITLAASSLPAGVTASFNPAYLPPGGAVTAFTLTVQTPKTAASLLRKTGLGFAVLFLPWLCCAAPRRKLMAGGACFAVLLATTGCGARVFALGAAQSLGTSYPITVSGTATSPEGSVLLHTVVVTVNVQ